MIASPARAAQLRWPPIAAVVQLAFSSKESPPTTSGFPEQRCFFYERHGCKGLNLSSPSAATAVPSIPPELNIAAAGRACCLVQAYYMLGSIDFLLHRGATSAFIKSLTRWCLLCRLSPPPPPLAPVTESTLVLPPHSQQGIVLGFCASPTETDLTVFDLISIAAILTWQSQEWRVKHKSVCAVLQCTVFHAWHRKIVNVKAHP